jgi:hypothetical protein
MPDTFTIAAQFNGPPGSGNGGYVCGRLARFVGGVATATLRAPPPLDTPIEVRRSGEGVTAHYGDALIAEAAPAAIGWTAPPAPRVSDADAATKRYRGLQTHYFPGCFTCGTARGIDDGLRIFTGPVEGRDMVATTWTPSAAFADANGAVAPEFVWAALDCPTYWAHGEAIKQAVLARLTLDLAQTPRVGDTTIIAAWPLASEGRKHTSRAALYAADGAVLARAEALWIELKHA